VLLHSTFAAGPGGPPTGPRPGLEPRHRDRALLGQAKVLWSSTPWAKFPDPIGPSSGSTRHPVKIQRGVSWTTRTVLCSKHCRAVSLVRPCCKAAAAHAGWPGSDRPPWPVPAACGLRMASLGRSAKRFQYGGQAGRKAFVRQNCSRRHPRRAQSVCVCIEHPLLGIKVCCQRLLSLLSTICSWAVSHQLTEVMGNAQIPPGRTLKPSGAERKTEDHGPL